jgi:hypothetical protein
LKRTLISFMLLFFCFASGARAGCDMSACSFATAHECRCGSEGLFTAFTFEAINWDRRDPNDAHRLHHAGRHAHAKTHEEFYWLTVGAANGPWTFSAMLPYVVRHALEVDDHDRIGQKERSEGPGDAKLLASYRAWQNGESYAGPVFGVKLPTGNTKEKTGGGARFEPELQPGSGAFDGIAGGTFQLDLGRHSLGGNVLGILKGDGDQDFEYGDVFSVFLHADRLMTPADTRHPLRLGVDASLVLEARQEQFGAEMEDSGGTTLSLGPSLRAGVGKSATFFANLLVPVYQDLGGVHQEVDYAVNSGFHVSW